MNQPVANSSDSNVSVIIPAYNSGKFLPAAIESVLSQTYTQIEIIVVDDGSIDDTKMVCDRYPTVTYIYQSNQGYLAARNRGIEISKAAYLIFLDSDDCLLPQAVEIGINCLNAHPEAGFVFGRYVFRAVNPDGSYSTQKLFDEPPPVASYATILDARHNIQCATAIVRREAVESIGGFALGLEDLNLWLRIASTCPIYYHDLVVSEYRYHGSNFSSESAKMLASTLHTIDLEGEYVRQTGDPELIKAYERGRATWIKFYGNRLLYDAIRLAQAGALSMALETIQLVLNYDIQLNWVDREVYQIANDLLLAPQQQQLLAQRQQPQQSYPQTKCLHQLFEAQVARTPDAIAICYERQQLTYRQLNDRANQLAHRLQAVGVKPEVLVGIGLERSLELIIGILGILKAGGAYVPLDPTYPQERLAYMLGDAQVPVLVTSSHSRSVFGGYGGEIVCVDELDPELARANPVVAGLTPDNLAYIIYTSGSTGRPKGVLVTHANVGRLFDATQEWYRFDDRDVWTLFHSYAFDFSVWELWGALIYGGRLVIVPVNASRSPQEFYELLERERVSVLNQTPSAFRQLLRVASDPQAAKLGLRLVIFGGEALDLHSLQPWFAKYGDKTPQLVNMYGITETTVHVTCRPIGIADLERGSTIGRPIPDLELYILDPELQQVKIGVEGEMYVGGAGVARGYLNRPELTAERFIPHPFRMASGDVLYKTGDLARYLPNGDIEYLGRIDNQVKIRGFRIELGEIESTLARQPQVQAAVVVVTEDEPGDLRLVAYLVPASETPIAIGDLRAKLREQLPDYMVPSSFVCVAAIPLTANGKIDRQALVALPNSSPSLPPKTVGAGISIVAILTTIWAEILRVESVGIEDNFFDLGGNSLLGLKVIDRIQIRFQLKVAVVRLYQYPTIRSMAAYLTEAMQGRSIVPTPEPIAAPNPATHTGIAVIGMVGRFPGAASVEQLWENLCAGRESITFFEEDEIDPSIDRALLADPNYVRAKGVLAGAELFDAGFFGMGVKEAEVMDPQARIFVELASEALEQAGYTATADNKIGVYAGSAENTYFERHLSGRAEIIDRFGELQTHLVNDRDYLPTRASYKLNLKGPSISISTACSTSLVAIIQAVQGLLSHQCDLALAGGIAIGTPQNQGYLHQEGSIFTPDGHCRPFDAAAQGTSFNNGAGIVVLKRVDDAIAAGDRIYAVIKGVGINNDGADKVSFTAPSISGQMGAILQAQQMAGVDPATIAYIEAHGTATALGDPIEVEALTQAFRTKTNATQFCGIGSIKSNLGHLTAAAGVAGLIKTVLAIYHRQIPPSINFDRPNPHIDFASSPFYVNTKLVDWDTPEPRRAGVSSFGGGGTNAHVILEQAPPSLAASPARPYQLLLLSGKTELAIDRLTTNLQEHLQHHPELDLADVAYTLQQGRKTFERRRFIVAKDRAQAIDYLATLPPHHTATRRAPSQQPELVFMFSGQGTQYLNMGANLYRSAPVFRQAIDRCTEILQPLLDLDIRNLLYPAAANSAISKELLNQTRYTQPAIFAIEYALMQLWRSWGLTPAAAIGHSIGEIVAACLAGVFSLPDALKLVAARGKLMWDLPTGAMLSVRLPAADVALRLTPALAIAAINGSHLCVVSGTHAAIEQLQQELEREEIVCKLLQTSHAFHSPMMESIVAPFADVVKNMRLSPPQIPFVSLVTADWITDEQAISPNYWADHLLKPVRFAEGVKILWRHNPNFVLLEVGSRQTLTTLARQQATDRTHQIAIASLGTTADDDADWQSILQAVGQLWLAGISIDWAQFSTDEHRYRVPLPTYPFERQKFWIEPLPHRDLVPAMAIDPITPATSQERIMHTEQLIPTAPRTTLLIPEIAAVFKDTAGVEIGATEQLATFLELGLDSLSLTQVALSLKKKFKVKVTFRQLLEDCSTLDALAHSIDRQLPPDAAPAPVASISTPIVNPTPVAAPSPILPAVSVINPVPPSPIAAPAPDSAIASLVQQQLQIMARQLELLGGNNIAPPAPAPIPQTPVVALPAVEAAHQSNGHSTAPNPILPAVAKPVTAPAPGTKIGRSLDTSLTPAQQIALAHISDRYIARTSESKRQAQAHRSYLADPRTVSGFTPLLKEMVYPIVINRAQGSRLWDEDGHEYIDLTNGFGLNFFGWSPDFVTEALRAQLDLGMAIGPQTPLAGKVAKTIAEITGMERVAFCNTGSEAVMAAFRIARTVTGRDRIVIFANSYHGTFDEVLVRAGSDGSVPAAPGIMPNVCDNVLVLEYGTPASLEIIRNCADELAAVIVEPIQSRHPELQPRAFLQELRQITTAAETALIFDEVVTGFRVAPGGAQEYFGIRADIATYGKVVGGGLPIGILTGSATYMDALDGGFWQFGDRSIPEVGVTFFAGTFVRHPLALAAVEAVLTKLQAGGAQIQISIANKVKQLVEQLRAHCQLVGAPIQIEYFSSWFYITFPPTVSYGSLLFYLLRIQGIHVWEYRPCFLTLAHSDEDIERILWAFKVSIAELQSTGLLASAGNAIAINHNLPPQPGAKLGKDRQGNPAWFISDPQHTGKYLQLVKQLTVDS
ncbi:amino acid adenylation domain-containing protein [Chamaesiphon sp.]|uniref:amino acid adenylation domain-containing protein n=1 Tax=Chamaesiphon sp. TaxID=2814140 RepID=UPI0035934579